jgi:hypothetical protein
MARRAFDRLVQVTGGSRCLSHHLVGFVLGEEPDTLIGLEVVLHPFLIALLIHM